MVIVEPLVLQRVLVKQNIITVENINALFNPSNYLVSPFNSTDKFLAGQYFLTGQQTDIKRAVIKRLNVNSGNHFTSIIGSSGTGRTLLTYDIANNLIDNGKRVLLVHCGNLNEGHNTLIENGWNISHVKFIKDLDVSDYDVIFIDEIQRIWLLQFNNLVEKIKTSACKCVFSYDRLQTLDSKEASNDIPTKISLLLQIVIHSLSEKIRTNK